MSPEDPKKVSEFVPNIHWSASKLYSDEQIKAIMAEERALKVRSKAQTLLEQSHVPTRNLIAPLLVGDQWKEVLDGLSARLGQGFLFCLCGNRSTGKTQIGVELIRKTCRAGHAGNYCTATEFLLDIKATYKDGAKETEGSVIKLYRDPRLLVIDEFSKRKGSEWEFTLFFELLNRRYGDMTDTLLICNNQKDELPMVLGDSLLARMSETGGIIECNWPGFRG